MENSVKLIPINELSQEINACQSQNIRQIGSEVKWKKGLTGKGVTVAILDSGIDISHDKLKGNIVNGFNFSQEDNNDFSIYQDYNGHGTHTAGIVTMIAPQVNLLILKVLNKDGVGTVQSLIDAINFAIDWKGENEERVRVISLSLGTSRPVKELHAAIKRALKNNIPVVVAVGNEGDGNFETNEVSYPAYYEEVIGVGAINDIYEIATFSNTNKEVDIYAPGVNVYSTYLKNGQITLSGTSMAAPHVTGSLALLIEEYECLFTGNLSEEKLYELLIKNTRKIELDNNNFISTLWLNNKQLKIKID